MIRLSAIPYALSLWLLCAPAVVSSGTCENERKEWISLMENSNLKQYIDDPALFFGSWWSPAANLANCMNAFFKKESEANSGSQAEVWKQKLSAEIPDIRSDDNYTQGAPKLVNESWKFYKAGLSALHANQHVQHEGSTLLAQTKAEGMEGVCCLKSFNFVVQWHKYPGGKYEMACHEGAMVRGFSTAGKFQMPYVDMGLFAKVDSEGKALDNGHGSYATTSDYKKLSEEAFGFDDDKYLAGQAVEKGPVTNLTEQLFLDVVNKDKVLATKCKADPSVSFFHGVMAIEPLGRGHPYVPRHIRKTTEEIPPIPIPQLSMLHREGNYKVTYARVTSPKVYLVAIRFACPASDIQQENYHKCNWPEMWPLKETTHVGGVGLRPYKPSWRSVKGHEITFHKAMGPDEELIIIFSLLGGLLVLFTLVVKCKNCFLSRTDDSSVPLKDMASLHV